MAFFECIFLTTYQILVRPYRINSSFLALPDKTNFTEFFFELLDIYRIILINKGIKMKSFGNNKETTKLSNVQKILNDLEKLCQTSDYIHIIAFFCYKNDSILFSSETKTIISEIRNEEYWLIRKEISLLIGLMVKTNISLSLPSHSKFSKLIKKTIKLLSNLRNALSERTQKSFWKDPINNNPFNSGEFWESELFYSPDTSFDFQYLEFAKERYSKDEEWFLERKGYSPVQLYNVLKNIKDIQQVKSKFLLSQEFKDNPNKYQYEFLSIFTFSIQDLIIKTKSSAKIISLILTDFCIKNEKVNSFFSHFSDINQSHFYPIIQLSNDEFVLLQYYNLCEAFYEKPSHEMLQDSNYKKASQNRGDFLEELLLAQLSKIFPQKNLFPNCILWQNKQKMIGEIDLLITYANKAVIFQAKSKRLTKEAKKGNKDFLLADFKESTTASYNQALRCAKSLMNDQYKITDKFGSLINLERNFEEIFIFCIVSDYYPLLSHQIRHFLKYEKNEVIKPPIGVELFSLDMLCEFLKTPLLFLDYLNQREKIYDRLTFNREDEVLSFYLERGLNLNTEVNFFALDESCADKLYIGMQARRGEIPVSFEPKELTLRFTEGFYGEVVTQLSIVEDKNALDFGILLLDLDKQIIEKINKGFLHILKLNYLDNRLVDLSITSESWGMTIYINSPTEAEPIERLKFHSEIKKYYQKVQKWFGIIVNPTVRQLEFFVLNVPWEKDEEFEKLTNTFVSKPF